MHVYSRTFAHLPPTTSRPNLLLACLKNDTQQLLHNTLPACSHLLKIITDLSQPHCADSKLPDMQVH